jgi:hypothetical protein
MAMDTFIVLAASYDTRGAAEADYYAVRDFYLTSGLLDTYDAAAITKDDAGKVGIVARNEQSTRQGAWRGLGIGLVGGVLVALFPAVGSGDRLLLGGPGGVGLGAPTSRISASCSTKGTAGWWSWPPAPWGTASSTTSSGRAR